jgi:hypothetical protein
MVFAIVGQKCQHRVLVLDLSIEHGFIPMHHLLETASAVNNVSELCRANARHNFLLFIPSIQRTGIKRCTGNFEH